MASRPSLAERLTATPWGLLILRDAQRVACLRGIGLLEALRVVLDGELRLYREFLEAER